MAAQGNIFPEHPYYVLLVIRENCSGIRYCRKQEKIYAMAENKGIYNRAWFNVV